MGIYPTRGLRNIFMITTGTTATGSTDSVTLYAVQYPDPVYPVLSAVRFAVFVFGVPCVCFVHVSSVQHDTEPLVAMSEPYLSREDVGASAGRRDQQETNTGAFFVRVGKLFVAGV